LDGDRKKKLPLKRPFLRPKVLASSTDARARSYQNMLKRRANSSFNGVSGALVNIFLLLYIFNIYVAWKFANEQKKKSMYNKYFLQANKMNAKSMCLRVYIDYVQLTGGMYQIFYERVNSMWGICFL
jgi:hypothetical protein